MGAFSEATWRLSQVSPISRISWSAIRRVGQSRLLALTIIVPFLGSFLIFNQHVISALAISPELVKRWLNLPKETTADVAETIAFARLYFLYFGLSFLGIGSALFAAFCPITIKNNASNADYLKLEGPMITKARVGMMVPHIAAHFSNWSGDSDDFSRTIQKFGEPSDFTYLFSTVTTDIYIEMGDEDVPQDEFEDGEHPFTDRRGKPDAWRIAKVLHSGSRIQEGFVYHFQSIASNDSHRNDFLTLNYMADDYRRPTLRILVAGFYGLGFLLLAIPTAVTFARILWYLVN
ncbi:MAG TPA: hypothetical protein VNR88_08335 [Hyphomicrobium sp.]|nr:hypothetical protein [Hyphomicrobium sp.]